MRNNVLNRFIHLIYQHCKIIWSFVSVLIIILALCFNLELSDKRCQKEVIDITKDLSKQVDGFIEDLFQEVYTLPLYDKAIHTCTADLNSNLKRIILNNPNISGLIISNENHQVICSTIGPDNLGTSLNSRRRSLLGPFTLGLFDQPIYLVQQKMGPYYINILLVATMLKTELETSTALSSAVVLYDNFKQKDLIQIEHSDDHKSWIISSNSSPTSSTHFVVEKLQSIDGLYLKVFENPTTVRYHLWLSQIIIFLSALVICFLLYGYITHRISKPGLSATVRD